MRPSLHELQAQLAPIGPNDTRLLSRVSRVLADTPRLLAARRDEYSYEKPDTSLDGDTPAEFGGKNLKRTVRSRHQERRSNQAALLERANSNA